MTLQETIIDQLGVKPNIDPKEEIRKSVDFLKAYMLKHPFLKSYVLGISGGQDSTLAGRLAQLAVEELRAETGKNYQFIAIRLPYGVQADEDDAQRALAFIKPDVSLAVNIKEAVDGQVAELARAGVSISDFNKGNIKARQRMITQYAVAGENSGAVIGTDHAAENLTGFFTKFGDGGADILPLFRLNKRQGAALLAELGADKALYEKVPTADLEEDKPGIADEVALGVTYREIDDYVEGKEVSAKAQETIENWWRKGQHKRHLPITIFDDFWKRAFDFRGRSTRPDYWWVYLINVIINTILVVGFILIPFFSSVSNDPTILNDSAEIQKMILKHMSPIMIFGLIILIPQLSLQFRRLRDAGIHPAWGLLSCMGLVPVLTILSPIGSIVLIIMSCQPTKPTSETIFDKVE